MSKIINLGILAHVDAGKTSLTEQFLFNSGSIKEAGSVDKGSAISDQMSIEKQRGISIKTSSISFNWNDTQINLIDTPGHADFIAEVERILEIIDVAVLVISAVEGLQSNTYILYETLKELKIPFFIFINKIDRIGANSEAVVNSLRKEFKANLFQLNLPHNEAENDVNIISFLDNTFLSSILEQNIESIANLDEKILEKFLNEEEILKDELINKAFAYSRNQDIIPVFRGSAKSNIGINDLLHHICNSYNSPNSSVNSPSAIVYKIEHHPKLGKLTHIKLLQGQLKAKDIILNQSKNEEFKISQIKKQWIQKIQDIDQLQYPDVGIISGNNNCEVWDILGEHSVTVRRKKIKDALLSTQVKPENDTPIAALADALSELSIEDPDLSFKWYKKENELQLNLHGPIQKEVLHDLIKDRFNLDCSFEEPKVIYKETPINKAEGFVRYWMPKPCWAIMRFEIEALERGSGVIYESKVGVNDIHQKYQNEVAQTISKALEQGIKGWEVTDIKITLIEGEDHEIHSRPGDFKLATPMGIMNGLKNSGTQLLEPMLFFEIIANENILGTINSELLKRRAQIENPEFENENFTLTGIIPLSTSIDLSIALNSISSGKAKLRTKFHSYQACSNEEGKIREFKGVNPLDESLWILHHRGAYK